MKSAQGTLKHLAQSPLCLRVCVCVKAEDVYPA